MHSGFRDLSIKNGMSGVTMGRTSYVGPNDVFGAMETTFRTPIGLLYFLGPAYALMVPTLKLGEAL
jgi:hypothetical protein